MSARSQAPTSQRFNSLWSRYSLPETAAPSWVETYGIGLALFNPRLEKSPCGFDHSRGTMIPAVLGLRLQSSQIHLFEHLAEFAKFDSLRAVLAVPGGQAKLGLMRGAQVRHALESSGAASV